MLAVKEWHEVHVLAFACFAIGGCVRSVVLACDAEIGAGVNACA
jgi:hypothetical protein